MSPSMRCESARKYKTSRFSGTVTNNASADPKASANRRSCTRSRIRRTSSSTVMLTASEFQPSKFVPERQAEYPWPKGRLGHNELVGADEHAFVRVGEVLSVRSHVPGILRDTH